MAVVAVARRLSSIASGHSPPGSGAIGGAKSAFSGGTGLPGPAVLDSDDESSVAEARPFAFPSSVAADRTPVDKGYVGNEPSPNVTSTYGSTFFHGPAVMDSDDDSSADEKNSELV